MATRVIYDREHAAGKFDEFEFGEGVLFGVRNNETIPRVLKRISPHEATKMFEKIFDEPLEDGDLCIFHSHNPSNGLIRPVLRNNHGDASFKDQTDKEFSMSIGSIASKKNFVLFVLIVELLVQYQRMYEKENEDGKLIGKYSIDEWIIWGVDHGETVPHVLKTFPPSTPMEKVLENKTHTSYCVRYRPGPPKIIHLDHTTKESNDAQTTKTMSTSHNNEVVTDACHNGENKNNVNVTNLSTSNKSSVDLNEEDAIHKLNLAAVTKYVEEKSSELNDDGDYWVIFIRGIFYSQLKANTKDSYALAQCMIPQTERQWSLCYRHFKELSPPNPIPKTA